MGIDMRAEYRERLGLGRFDATTANGESQDG
jgi:hypothetical protein